MNQNDDWRWAPSLDQILERVRVLPGSTVVIGVSGYGGSGKSTLALALAKELRAPVVSIDEFGTAAVFERSEDWRGFDRSRLVRQVLVPLKSGGHEVSYDRCDDWESWETVCTRLLVGRFLVLEGVGLFHPEILPYLDFRIWLDVSLPESTAHGVARERSLGRDVSVEFWEALWEPNERDFERKFRPREAANYLVRPAI